jgi:hypothetical protein
MPGFFMAPKVEFIILEGNELIMIRDDENLDQYLYHYTSFQTLLEKILPSQQLRLSSLKNMNDPRESKEFGFQPLPSSLQPDSEQFYDVTNRLNSLWKNNCKIICFTRDNPTSSLIPIPINNGRGFAHSRMWAQYAGNHTGVCLRFDKYRLSKTIQKVLSEKGKLFQGEVNYGTDFLKIHQVLLLDFNEISISNLTDFSWKHCEKYMKELFFEKMMDWKEEWEYRWILFSNGQSNYEYFNYGDALDSIILGLDFPEAYYPIIGNYCKEFKVSAYKLRWFNGFALIAMYDNETENNIFRLPF